MSTHWDGLSTVELFLRALRKGTEEHELIRNLREKFPSSWEKALKIFKEERKPEQLRKMQLLGKEPE